MQCLQLTRGEAPSMDVTVTLTGTFHSSCAYVTIDGTKYTSATTLTVKKGTEITCSIAGQTGASITMNGMAVTTGVSTYSFTATENCTIKGSYRTMSGRITTGITITMPA